MSQRWYRNERLVRMSKQENQNKRNKPDHNSSPSAADMSTGELAKLIADGNKATQAKIDRLGDDLRNELKTRLDGIKADLNALKAEFEGVKTDVSSNTDAIAIDRLSNDLIISGVPFLTHEDLYDYFQRWCLALGYSANSIPLVDLRRLSRGELRSGNKCFILLQFAITNQRNDFFSRYLRQHTLTLAQIGFKSQDRVYVNENLTISARKVKSMALTLKKEGKLINVYSRGGVVNVRLPNSNQDRAVSSVEELQGLVQHVNPFPK